MSDFKRGEVLVPASRFLPKCEHDHPRYAGGITRLGKDGWWTFQPAITCGDCETPYEREDTYGVEGIPHGNP